MYERNCSVQIWEKKGHSVLRKELKVFNSGISGRLGMNVWRVTTPLWLESSFNWLLHQKWWIYLWVTIFFAENLQQFWWIQGMRCEWSLRKNSRLLLLVSDFSHVRLCATPYMAMGCHPWDSPGKNTGLGCHLLLQCMKVKSESEVAQLCLTLSDPMDCSLPGSSIHGIFQARVLE